jgi:hypothetical protein
MTPQKLTRLCAVVTGERGLLLAVIGLAYRDLQFGTEDERLDAQRYFSSQAYQHHLEMLGLPTNMRPVINEKQQPPLTD